MALRVSQYGLEVIVTSSPSEIVTQYSIEAIVSANPNIRLSQYSIEAIVIGTPAVRVAQHSIEVLKSSGGNVSKSFTINFRTKITNKLIYRSKNIFYIQPIIP